MSGDYAGVRSFEAESYLPGALSLLDQLDKKMVVQLRDGRTLVGFLRTLDQFGNLVLQRTVERIHVGRAFGDIPRGIFLVRGENVVLAGEVDGELERRSPLEQVSVQEILSRQRAQQDSQKDLDDLRTKALQERGLAAPASDLHDDAF